MHWGVRALIVAVFGVVLYVSVWSYQNYYFLLLLKRMMSVHQNENFTDISDFVTKQPATTVSPIVLAVPPKQGTTWLGNLCFQVRARGAPIPERNLMLDMPYLEPLPMITGSLTGQRNISGNIEPPLWELSKVEPHFLRTHLHYPKLKELGLFPKYRTITLFREPMDALVSAWRFIPPLVHIEPSLIDPNVFARFMLWATYDAVLQNMVDYWNHRNDPNVLMLFFDELKDDLAGSVRRVAKFINMSPPLTEEELKTIEAQCTHTAMSGLPRFEVDLGDDVVFRALNLPPEQRLGRKGLLVRPGGGTKGESNAVLAEDVRKQMLARWNAIVAEKTGMQNFTHYMKTLQGMRVN